MRNDRMRFYLTQYGQQYGQLKLIVAIKTFFHAGEKKWIIFFMFYCSFYFLSIYVGGGILISKNNILS